METPAEIGSYAGIISFVMVVTGAIYAAINHRQLRSRCCGRRMDVSLDIGPTQPSPEAPLLPRPCTKNPSRRGSAVEAF
jgi:hypothetical protein